MVDRQGQFPGSSAEVAHRRLTMNAHTLISTYRPHLPETNRTAIADLVREIVRAYTPGRTYEATRVALIVLSGFADWVYSIAAAPLTAAILRPDLINAYEAYRRGEVQPNIAARERKLLFTLSGFPLTAEIRAYSTKSSVAPPYGAAELATFREWATWQPNLISRISANGLVGLGLGCGLRRSELVLIHRRHIHHAGATTTVDVPGPRARTIPVAGEWADHLTYAAETSTGFLVAPRATIRTSDAFRGWFVRAQGAAPVLVRMRNTWLLDRIHEGLPADELVADAGVKEIRSLEHIILAHANDHRTLLHGARSKR